MKFHVLLPVRDEADLIRESLITMLRWADLVHVFDTGSIDDTWDIVTELARQDPRILPIGSEPVYFSEQRVRGYIFDRARRHMVTGDWVVRADVDEFHHISPPDFVRGFLKPHETNVWHLYYDFCLTESEARKCEEQGDHGERDRTQSIVEQRRHYKIGTYTDQRMFRYRNTMQWTPDSSQPRNCGYLAVQRIPIRHYPHRDPAQLHRRCLLRAAIMAEEENIRDWGADAAPHWKVVDWRRFVVADSDPGLRYWAPGTDLPILEPDHNHLGPPAKRVLQRIAHAAFLPVLDRIRAPYPSNLRPRPIPSSVQELLKRESSRLA